MPASWTPPERRFDRRLMKSSLRRRHAHARHLRQAAFAALGQPITNFKPTAVSSVALAACKETAQVWSPTMPSCATPPLGKTKCLNRAEFVVVGWSDPEGSRPCVGALLLGHDELDGPLVCAGRVGTGIGQKALRVGRANLWMSHQPMISLRSSAEFIAAPSPPFSRLWISSTRFADKWSRQVCTDLSRGCRPSGKGQGRSSLAAISIALPGQRCRHDSE